MKTLERLVLQFQKSIIDPLLDRFQFAYRNNRSVDDAVALGLFYVLQHLDSPNTYARILCVDFSSAFNTIIPSKLFFYKIQSLGGPQSMYLWILDFLLNMPQVVKQHSLGSQSGGVASHWATYALVFLGSTSSTPPAHIKATFRIARHVLAGSRSTRRFNSRRRWSSRTFSITCSRNILSQSSAITDDVLCRRSTSSTRPCE